jgi:hypothetical protein
MPQRRYGVRQLQIDGVTYLARGGCSYSPGGDKLESIMGLDRRHGVKVARIPAYLEITIGDAGQGFNLKALIQIDDSTVTVDLENGKTIKLGHANYAAEGKVTAEEGEVEARFECDPENFEEI